MSEEIEKILLAYQTDLESYEEDRINALIGVQQAVQQLKDGLVVLRHLMETEQIETASAYGYNEISSGFVFVQRTLAGAYDVELKKQDIITSVAGKVKRSYEEVEPVVEKSLELLRQKDPFPDDDASRPLLDESVRTMFSDWQQCVKQQLPEVGSFSVPLDHLRQDVLRTIKRVQHEAGSSTDPLWKLGYIEQEVNREVSVLWSARYLEEHQPSPQFSSIKLPKQKGYISLATWRSLLT